MVKQSKPVLTSYFSDSSFNNQKPVLARLMNEAEEILIFDWLLKMIFYKVCFTVIAIYEKKPHTILAFNFNPSIVV